MRAIHEITLLLGALLLSPIFVTNKGLPCRYISLSLLAFVFVISTYSGIILAFRHRSLPARTVATYFLAVLGLAFMCMACVNDLWMPLTYGKRFTLMISVVIVLFVTPWVSLELVTHRRTPLPFDVCLAPFLATVLYLICWPKMFRLLWDSHFWYYFVLSSVPVTCLIIFSPVSRGKSTLFTLCTSTAICFLILGTLMPPMVGN